MTTPPRPMLAHRLTPRNKPPFPFYVQPKLNGIRALWDGTNLWSRDGHAFSPTCLPHIYTALYGITLHFDGELYCHGLSLQEINSRVAVNRTTQHPEVFSISYCIFDYISPSPFNLRHEELSSTTLLPPLIYVPTIFVSSPTFEETCYRLFKSQSYEGMMYRSFNESYGMPENCGNQENRWKCLLKRKDWLDEEFAIVDVVEGEGRFKGMCGALVLMTKDGKTFQAGSGLNFIQRRELWEYPPIGRFAKIKYEMLSDGGIPLKPTVEVILNELY